MRAIGDAARRAIWRAARPRRSHATFADGGHDPRRFRPRHRRDGPADRSAAAAPDQRPAHHRRRDARRQPRRGAGRNFARLPGQTSIAVARLGEGAPVMLAGHEPDRALAIGSTFKLFILAELSRQIRAGERRWSDVVPLDRRSIPSGMLQNWPPGSPLTLHSLAALMISISDNSATDVLLRTLGRGNVERMMTTLGVAAAERNRPCSRRWKWPRSRRAARPRSPPGARRMRARGASCSDELCRYRRRPDRSRRVQRTIRMHSTSNGSHRPMISSA